MLNLNFVLNASCKIFQKHEVKWLSRSETIGHGTSWSLVIFWIYSSASLSIVYVVHSGIKYVDLVRQSTTTYKESFHWRVLGNPETKSIVTCSNFYSGISKGCKVPVGLWCSALICWQVRHFSTNLMTSLFIPDHQYCLLKSWYIFVTPGCTEYGVC